VKNQKFNSKNKLENQREIKNKLKKRYGF